jgi:hypothetical protein
MKPFYILIGLMLLLSGLSRYLLVSDTLYFNFFAEQLSYDRIEAMLAENKRWEWLAYLLIPLFYFIKCGLVALCLGTAHFFVADSFKIKGFFGLVATAELVFVLPAIAKIGWFLFVQTNYTLQDLQMFYPLSALHFFDTDTLQPYLLYPLQTLNVFELLYWFALAYGISKTFGNSMADGMRTVLSSYVLSLLVWVVFVMFLTVNFNP